MIRDAKSCANQWHQPHLMVGSSIKDKLSRMLSWQSNLYQIQATSKWSSNPCSYISNSRNNISTHTSMVSKSRTSRHNSTSTSTRCRTTTNTSISPESRSQTKCPQLKTSTTITPPTPSPSTAESRRSTTSKVVSFQKWFIQWSPWVAVVEPLSQEWVNLQSRQLCLPPQSVMREVGAQSLEAVAIKMPLASSTKSSYPRDWCHLSCDENELKDTCNYLMVNPSVNSKFKKKYLWTVFSQFVISITSIPVN